MEEPNLSDWSDARLESLALSQNANPPERGAARAELARRQRAYEQRRDSDRRDFENSLFNDQGKREVQRKQFEERLANEQRAHANELADTQMRHAEKIAGAQLQPSKSSARATTFAAVAAGLSVLAAGASAWISYMGYNDQRSDQRPVYWVGTNLGAPSLSAQPEGQVLWSVHPANLGKSLILDGHFMSYIKLGDGPWEISQGQPLDGSKIGPLAPGQDTFFTIVSPTKITAAQFDQLQKRDNGVQVKVVADYVDGSGGKYTTGMCFGRLISGAISFCREDNYVK